MWFCFNDAFVSVVQSDTPGKLMVRARAFEHLRHLFPDAKAYPIVVSKENDYRYRVFCSKMVWAGIVAERIDNINYTNFKNSVKDNKLHRLYEDFWFLHAVYQNGKKWKRQVLNYYSEALSDRKGG